MLRKNLAFVELRIHSAEQFHAFSSFIFSLEIAFLGLLYAESVLFETLIYRVS